MLRSLASNLLTVLIFGFFLIGAIGIWGKSQYVAEGPLQNAICFKVKSGTSMRTVVQDLVNDKAISSEFVFRVGMESSGLSRKIKAGSFLVPKNASMAEISKRLTESGVSNCGNQIIYRVGVTSLKIEIRDTDPNTGKMVKVGDFIFDEAADEKINDTMTFWGLVLLMRHYIGNTNSYITPRHFYLASAVYESQDLEINRLAGIKNLYKKYCSGSAHPKVIKFI